MNAFRSELGHDLRRCEHVSTDRLQPDLGTQEACRNPLHHAPLPGGGRVESGKAHQPVRAIPRALLPECPRVFAHDDAKVVFRFRKQAVGIDQAEAIIRFEGIPLVNVAMDQSRPLVVVGGDPPFGTG